MTPRDSRIAHHGSTGGRRSASPRPLASLSERSAKPPAARKLPNHTFGEFVESVIAKELWANHTLQNSNGLGEIDAEPGTRDGFSPAEWRQRLRKRAPGLTEDLIASVGAWIPSIVGVTPASLVPDLDMYPPCGSGDELEGLTLVQRKLLLDTIEVLLDTLVQDSSDRLRDGLPVMPRQGLACIAAQLAAVFEHLVLLRPLGLSTAHDNDESLDLSALRRICMKPSKRSNNNTKQALIEELQGCRKQIYDLEQDIAMTQRVSAEIANRGGQEAEKNMARILQVNHSLEEKLKQRTDDWRAARTQVEQLKQRTTHGEWLNQQNVEKIKRLQEELDIRGRMQEDLLAREREYGERMVRAQVSEYEQLVQHDERTRHLNLILQDKRDGATEEMSKSLDMVAGVQKQGEKVLHELQTLFDERQTRIMQSVHEAVNVTKEKDIERLQAELTFARSSTKRPEVREANTQTEQEEVSEARMLPKILERKGPKSFRRPSMYVERKSVKITASVMKTLQQLPVQDISEDTPPQGEPKFPAAVAAASGELQKPQAPATATPTAPPQAVPPGPSTASEASQTPPLGPAASPSPETPSATQPQPDAFGAGWGEAAGAGRRCSVPLASLAVREAHGNVPLGRSLSWPRVFSDALRAEAMEVPREQPNPPPAAALARMTSGGPADGSAGVAGGSDGEEELG
eukprot:TRINITY_DN46844_c0_g1_i1.p1 TRINITY_DN46844_c0_g1~~TRINITY_DN46844_c0_g1_i1.p1  ORF type:complete len:687 (-),score=168.36 TRINITY_DN46844_c0_g1_i1:102-2162(-)